jgi:hypothetical protein
MPAFDPIDAWFEEGFRVRRQRRVTLKRDKIRSGGGRRYVPVNGVRFSGTAKTTNIRAVIKRAPEVMVKITGHSTGLSTARHHIEYIGRNGNVELEDERGNILTPKGVLEGWKASQIPNESKRREFLHVLFSMPPGTPETGFKKAVQEFCREEFATRQYVLALHQDTDHVHAHVCVSTRDLERADEPRLSPRKKDLFRWRLGFADKLRQNGIDAAASERKHRFRTKKAEHAVVRQIRADNPASTVYNKRRADRKTEDRIIQATLNPDKAFVGPLRPARTPRVYEALADELKTALATNQRPENPAQAAIEANHEHARTVWDAVAVELETQGDPLANDVRALLRAADKPIVSKTQELYDLALDRTRQTPEQDI